MTVENLNLLFLVLVLFVRVLLPNIVPKSTIGQVGLIQTLNVLFAHAVLGWAPGRVGLRWRK